MGNDELGDAVSKLLSHEINSIRSHRSAVRRDREQREADIDEAWQAVVATARDLRRKVAHQERLRYFNIARDDSELTISFRGIYEDPREIRTFSLFRNHPEGRHTATHAIWCRETFVRDDRRFTNAEDAIHAMVKFCAVNMV